MDSQSRTILKSVTWRVVATLITIATVFIFSGDLILSIGSGVTANLIKALFYYFHERIWNRISFGRT